MAGGDIEVVGDILDGTLLLPKGKLSPLKFRKMDVKSLPTAGYGKDFIYKWAREFRRIVKIFGETWKISEKCENFRINYDVFRRIGEIRTIMTSVGVGKSDEMTLHR